MLNKIKAMFDADERRAKALDKHAAKLVSKNYQHEDRMMAIEELAREGTPRTIGSLFRRWDIQATKEREDLAEKEYLADVLVSKGLSMLPQLQEHMNRSIYVTWPIKVLRRVVGAEEVVTELLRVLDREMERVASFKPEKKVKLLQLLADYPADPRLPAAIIPCIEDFDETVRFEAACVLSRCGDEQARLAVLARLVDPEEDSDRVKSALVACAQARGWKASGDRVALQAALPGNYSIAPDGSFDGG